LHLSLVLAYIMCTMLLYIALKCYSLELCCIVPFNIPCRVFLYFAFNLIVQCCCILHWNAIVLNCVVLYLLIFYTVFFVFCIQSHCAMLLYIALKCYSLELCCIVPFDILYRVCLHFAFNLIVQCCTVLRCSCTILWFMVLHCHVF